MSGGCAEAGAAGMSVTGHQMVIDHAGGLHERIADRGSHELEACPGERLAHRVGFRRFRGHLGRIAALVLDRLLIDELPEEVAE